MESRIVKWGNSLGLRIPKAFAREVGAESGTTVDLTVEDGDLIVRVRRSQGPTLGELLARVTEDNLHGEIGAGPPVGREVW